MEARAYLVGAAVVLAVFAIVFRVVVRRSYRQRGRLSSTASVAQYLAFLSWVAFGWLNLPDRWPSVLVGPIQETLGWVLFAGGWALTLWALFGFGVRRSHGLRVDGLRTSGLYGLCRNPQATAFLAAMLGYAVLWPTWRVVGVVVLAGVLIHAMVLTEEEHLREVFGAEYRRYVERIPRYVPLRRRWRQPPSGSASTKDPGELL